jgi:hypothetical protein
MGFLLVQGGGVASDGGGGLAGEGVKEKEAPGCTALRCA